MSESCAVEVYENETYSRKNGWGSYKKYPFVLKSTLTACKPLDEISVPSSDWQWSTNWKITKMPGVTDADGWEYASRFSRFKSQDRAPKSEAMWSRARRRLWTRIMRREPHVKATDMTKLLSKVQMGLGSIHAARVKIEEIMRQAPEAAESDQMRSLVTSVNRNIADILGVLDQAEKQGELDPTSGMKSSAVLKKLRNDVLKEQYAIEKALEPSSTITSSAPIPLNNGMRNGSMTTRTSFTSAFSNPNNQVNGSFSSGSYASNSFIPGSFSNNSSSFRSNRTLPSNSFSAVNSVTNNLRNRGSMVDAPDESKDLKQEMNGFSNNFSSGKSQVKSGSAGAFDPTIFRNNNAVMGDNNPDDGDFVDRTTHDMIIAQVRDNKILII